MDANVEIVDEDGDGVSVSGSYSAPPSDAEFLGTNSCVDDDITYSESEDEQKEDDTPFLDSFAPPDELLPRVLDSANLVFSSRFHIHGQVSDMSRLTTLLAQSLRVSGITHVSEPETYELPRTFYEVQRQVVNFRLAIARNPNVAIAHLQLVSMWIESYMRMFRDHSLRLQLELPTLPNFTPPIAAHRALDFSWLAMGSMPSPEMFLVRGDYIQNENRSSNVRSTSPFAMVAGEDASGHIRTHAASAHWEHDRRQVTLLFAVHIPPREDGLCMAVFRLVVLYSSIRAITVDPIAAPSAMALYLHLAHPPMLWEAIPRSTNQQSGQSASLRTLNMWTARDWLRVLQWPSGRLHSGCSTEALSNSTHLGILIPSDQEKVAVGGWDGRPWQVATRLITRAGVTAPGTAPVLFGRVRRIRRSAPVLTTMQDVGSFAANYSIQGLISRGYIVTDQLDIKTVPESANRFFEIVRTAMRDCSEAAEYALEHALIAVDERRHVSLCDAFTFIYTARLRAMAEAEADDTSAELPPNCVRVRKVVVTPSRTLFMAPEIMMTNRVVRKFGEEYAMRCVFREEDGRRLNMVCFSVGHRDNDESAGFALSSSGAGLLKHMVQSTLVSGITVDRRHYHFLAWSNSQMRDQGCYLYADAEVKDPTTEEVIVWTIDEIRNWMGDFSALRSVPKLMSRMAQCFTQAQPTVCLEKDDWTVEDDVEGGLYSQTTGNDPYCFTDGVGRISSWLARRISSMLHIELMPSCLQVRFKGIKGVLSVDPSLDYAAAMGLPSVVFRVSQKKFEEALGVVHEPALLEVVKYSQPSALCLNRPLIAILDHVSERQGATLHRKLSYRIHWYMQRELDDLAHMMMDETAAAGGLSSRLGLPIDWFQLESSGVRLTTEPFLRSLLRSVFKYNVTQHISKAKIQLPSSQGRQMYGVADESGQLQWGQVFVQYSASLRSPGVRPILHTGPVLVSKNPCHVGGDVRLLEAVDVPALRHLVDVVVFPVYGPRPHSDQMAGSDLDGDEYLVIFDSALHFDHNESAMNFPKPPAVQLSVAPTTEDMVDYLLRYLRQDSIGRISNAHLFMSDRLGLFHPICEGIAAKCSVAVDFPKTGFAAEPLRADEQCIAVPDYMEASGHRPSYTSHRLNGELYRSAKRLEHIVDATGHLPAVFADEFDTWMTGPDGWTGLFDHREHGASRLEDALAVRESYTLRLQVLLDEYGIGDEASLVSGHICALKRLSSMEKDDYSFYHTDKIVELRYSRLFEHYRRLFFNEFGSERDFQQFDSSGRPTLVPDMALTVKARCWYTVCYHPRHQPRSGRGFLSLPWVVWDVLTAHKRRQLLIADPNSIPSPRPLADAVGVWMRRHLKHDTDSTADRPDVALLFEEFSSRLSKNCICFVRYSRVYGDAYRRLLFVLYRWLAAEEIFVRTPLRMEHVVWLCTMFGLGWRMSSPMEDDSTPATSTAKGSSSQFLPYEVDPDADLETLPALADIDEGDFLLEFVRHVASWWWLERSPQTAIEITVAGISTDGATAAEPPAILQGLPLIALHQVAHRTLHMLCVSANFGVFHLVREDEKADSEEQYGEGDVVMASGRLAEQVQISRLRRILRKWSGVSWLEIRPDGALAGAARNGSASRSHLIVSAAGTAASRQRLHRLLLLDPAELLLHIKLGTAPSVVRLFSAM